MSIEKQYLSLWDAINEAMKKNLELAEEYSRKAEELRSAEPINSVGLRAQSIGLLYANNNLSQSLSKRGLLNLDYKFLS